MANPPNDKENSQNTWLKLPGIKSGTMMYYRKTGHLYTCHPDLKCADSQMFAMKKHIPECGYYLKRVLPSENCTAAWKKGDGHHHQDHGPPGRLEMEMMAFWWQVVLYMLAKYTDKSGDDVVEIVYQEWPFSMKNIFHPKELANIMRSTLMRYRELAVAEPQSSQGKKRTIFLKSHNQYSLDLFKSELKTTNNWWGPYEEDGIIRLCCVLPKVSSGGSEDHLARSSSAMSDAMSEKDLTADVDQFEQSVDPESLTGMKLMLESARSEAERNRIEADRLRRALTYLNYSIVPDGSELNQERIDEIIKVGEVAEMAGIEPGYLINSSSDPEPADESAKKCAASSIFTMNILNESACNPLCFPLFSTRPVIISKRSSKKNASPSQNVASTKTPEGFELRINGGQITQRVTREVRFAETLAKESMKIGHRNEMDVYAVALTKSSESGSTFERYVFGQAADDGQQMEHRTVLVLGATGSGQTKFINGIVNFVFNIEQNDKFRFQMINEDASNQTDCVKVYDIHHAKGFRVPFSLTIIDTPSYGTNVDNSELFKDEKTVKLLLDFFRNDAGIKELDMICYVIMETGVFNSVLSIFSSDVQENINCWHPGDYLSNNCSWQQITKRFVGVLSKMKPKSMALTLQTLEEMDRLKESVYSLQPISKLRSSKVKEMQNAKLLVATCEAQTKANEETSLDVQMKNDIEFKWSCVLSGARDLLAGLQLDLDMNKNEMLEHFVNVLRCIKQLKTISRRNPFLTQKLFDFLAEIEQQLQLCPRVCPTNDD